MLADTSRISPAQKATESTISANVQKCGPDMQAGLMLYYISKFSQIRVKDLLARQQSSEPLDAQKCVFELHTFFQADCQNRLHRELTNSSSALSKAVIILFLLNI